MKTKILTGSLLTAVLLATGFWAAPQRLSANQTPQDPATQGQPKTGMMGQGQGMMGGMTGMMGQMGTHHQQMTTLMNKLMESMKAIQNEKDPAALKSKLAEHQALLLQMRGHMAEQSKMMQMMSGQAKQSCPGASDAPVATPGG